MNTRFRSRAACALNALVLTLALVGCSKPAPTENEPLVTAPAPTARGVTVQSTLISNGLQSQYTARVNGGHIAAIEELRSVPDQRAAHGTYSFYEARLVKYEGDGINSAIHEEVEFDLHGAIKSAQASVGSISDEELNAIRNRAELLRSHALTQLAVREHQPN